MGGCNSKEKYTCCCRDLHAEKPARKKKQKNENIDPSIEFIKRYKILNKIGAGNFSKVFYCRGDNEKKFAMKLMCCSLKNTSHYNCFKRELHIMKMLNNKYPYIIKMLDYHEYIKKQYYIVKLILEYCEGGSLFEFVKIHGTCNQSDTRVIIIKLTKAIQYINSLKMMHRDIKPENILLRTKNNVRSVVLSDFGLAKVALPNQTAVKSRSICGSDFYLAPEMIKNKEYGTKIDIWSLGVMVFFIVVGKVPFVGRDANDLYNNILRADVNGILSKETAINTYPGFRDLLENMLVHDPNKRFSCSDILNHRWIRGTLSSYEILLFNSSSFIRKILPEEKKKKKKNLEKMTISSAIYECEDYADDLGSSTDDIVEKNEQTEGSSLKKNKNETDTKSEKSNKVTKAKYKFFLKKIMK